MDEKDVEAIIDLDVGGTRFRTTRQTLLSHPTSMLANMFHPESPFSPGMKKDGAYFLDRDPVYFRAVLNYLRSGHLDSDCNAAALLKEATFFGLSGLEAALQEQAKEQAKDQAKEQKAHGPGDVFLLNVGGQIFETTKYTLCKRRGSTLEKIVRGESKQQFDREGNLFIDQDPKDFVYILKGLRDFQPFSIQLNAFSSFSASKPIFVPKEAFSGIRIIDHELGLNMLDQFKCLD